MNPDATNGHGRIRIAAILAAIAWLPLLVLAALGSDGELSAFFGDFGVHVRLLVAAPLFFGIDAIRYRYTRTVVGYLDRSTLIADTKRERFAAAVAALERWDRGKATPAAVAILAAVGAVLNARADIASGTPAWFSDGSGTMASVSLAGWWYAAVGLPIWLYLFLRWCVSAIAWWRFLWVVSRLDLQLTSSHPDGCGGLGVLAIAQVALAFVAPAMSALLAAQLAMVLRGGMLTLGQLTSSIGVYTLIWMLIVTGPLFYFTPLLLRAKIRGLVAYGQLGDVLFGAFDKKWTTPDSTEQRRLLGDQDPSSLADYGYAYGVVAGMRFVPISVRDIIFVLALTLVPFLPLLLLKYSFGEILGRLLGILG